MALIDSPHRGLQICVVTSQNHSDGVGLSLANLREKLCAILGWHTHTSETTIIKGLLFPIRRSASAPLEAVCSSTCLRSVR